jgi:hypothetical protein
MRFSAEMPVAPDPVVYKILLGVQFSRTAKQCDENSRLSDIWN